MRGKVWPALGLLTLLLAAACGAPGGAETAEVPGSAGESPAAAPELLSYSAREGRALFQHYCATCHGPEGRGDGFNAYNLDPRPRDLADPAFQAQRSHDDLAAIIRLGGGAAGLSTAMPPWGRTLNHRQVQNLIVYLRTLPAAPPP